MFNLQGSEIIFILLLALVVLGPEKLPGAIKRAMQTYAELRKLGTGFQDEFRSAIDEPMREMRETADLIKDQVDPKKFAQEAERAAEAAAAADRADAELAAAADATDGDDEPTDTSSVDDAPDDFDDPFDDPIDDPIVDADSDVDAVASGDETPSDENPSHENPSDETPSDETRVAADAGAAPVGRLTSVDDADDADEAPMDESA